MASPELEALVVAALKWKLARDIWNTEDIDAAALVAYRNACNELDAAISACVARVGAEVEAA